jgi:hypothetical protein
MESSNSWNPIITPLFYIDKWQQPYNISGEYPADSLFSYLKAAQLEMPNYVVFAEDKNLEARLANIKRFIPNLVFDKYIESSYLDKTMYWLNPVNNNLTYTVYKVQD